MNNIVVCWINHYSYLRYISVYMIHTSHDFYITRERTMVKIFKYFVKNISLEDHKRSICFRFSNISIMFLCDAGMWIWNHFIFQYPDWKVNILSKQFFVNTNSFNLWLHIEVAVSSLYQKMHFSPFWWLSVWKVECERYGWWW